MTPVEELFEKLWDTSKDKFTWYAIRKEMLEKEKDVIMNAVDYGCSNFGCGKDAEDYYDLTFKTKEK